MTVTLCDILAKTTDDPRNTTEYDMLVETANDRDTV